MTQPQLTARKDTGSKAPWPHGTEFCLHLSGYPPPEPKERGSALLVLVQ